MPQRPAADRPALAFSQDYQTLIPLTPRRKAGTAIVPIVAALKKGRPAFGTMENTSMNFETENIKTPRAVPLLRLRRLALMASVVGGLGAAAFSLGQNFPNQGFLVSPAQAQVSEQAKHAQAPVGFADVVEQVKPAVIAVKVKIDRKGPEEGLSPFPPGSPMERFFRRFGAPDGMPPRFEHGPRRHNFVTGQGSGFFISADGYAVTNNHVVDGADEVEVTADDGKTYSAKVIGADPRTDLALIKVDGRKDFAYATLADAQPRIGDWVLAVGNPFGLGGSVTAGIVSARGRDIGAGPYDDFIQIDAPINKGNSGGPSFNVKGQVVGVNTAIFSPSGGNVGIAFSIPASTVRSVIDQLKTKGVVSRGWIGVQIQPVTQEIADSLGLKQARGALVAEPQEGSPAIEAGIQSGDVIVTVNGDEIRDSRELARTIGAMAPGAKVTLGIIRKGDEKTVALTLGTLPGQKELTKAKREKVEDSANVQLSDLGLTLAAADSVAGAGKDGVVITNVDAGSPGAERGLKAGEVILEVGGKSVATPGEVKSALKDAGKGGKASVLIRVKSDAGMRFVALPLKG